MSRNLVQLELPEIARKPSAGKFAWIRQFGFDESTFTAIRDRAPALAPLLVIAVLNLTVAVLMRPALAAALRTQPNAVGYAAEAFLWLVAVFYPAIVLAKVLLLVAVAWSVVALLEESARWRQLFSVLLFGEILMLLQAAFTVIVLHARGLDALRAPADLIVHWGLAAFIDVQGPVAVALVQHATVFHAFWLLFVTVALVRSAALTRFTAVATALSVWGTTVAFDAVRGILAGG